MVLIDFSLNVNAATLIFISVRGSAISTAKEGKYGFIYILVRVIKLFRPGKRACIHESPDRIYTDLTLLTLKALITKRGKILLSAETL